MSNIEMELGAITKFQPIIISGYPPKEYTFTGEWIAMPRKSGRNIASRNNHTVEHPLYRAADGDQFVLASVERQGGNNG